MFNMIDIEILGRTAIDIIKSKYTLPDSGFLAGGSIANIIWELVSGNKAVVNDVDIFILSGVQEIHDDSENPYFIYNEKQEDIYLDCYGGLCICTKNKGYFKIESTERVDILNKIYYTSNTDCPSIVLSSFDLNAVKVGYDIKSDKLFYCDDFVDFLKSGELKVSNVKTPCHTLIRMIKKTQDMNAKLDDFEINLIKQVIRGNFSDIFRHRFSDKIFSEFLKNSEILEKYSLSISRDHAKEAYVEKTHGEKINLYYLLLLDNKDIFNDDNLDSIYACDKFIFYMRNIYNNEKLRKIWAKVSMFCNNMEYFDKEVTDADVELIKNLLCISPGSIKNLRHLKISEQVYLIKKVLNTFKDDIVVGISILEKLNINKDTNFDNKILYELMVRKESINVRRRSEIERKFAYDLK
jgi:hypothetical protein